MSGAGFIANYLEYCLQHSRSVAASPVEGAKRIGYNAGYTGGVKTAISVPDDLYRLAEAAARRLRVSRSRLYATAISEFLNRQQGSAVTERLNDVYSRRPAKVDSALHRAQLRSVDKDSW